jgi:hypothetical protein
MANFPQRCIPTVSGLSRLGEPCAAIRERVEAEDERQRARFAGSRGMVAKATRLPRHNWPGRGARPLSGGRGPCLGTGRRNLLRATMEWRHMSARAYHGQRQGLCQRNSPDPEAGVGHLRPGRDPVHRHGAPGGGDPVPAAAGHTIIDIFSHMYYNVG